jgi:hypothetical protein
MKLEYNVCDLLDIANRAVVHYEKKYKIALEKDNEEKLRINAKVNELIENASLWQSLFWSQKKFHKKALEIYGYSRWIDIISSYKIYEFKPTAPDVKSIWKIWQVRQNMLKLTFTSTVWLTDEEIVPYASHKDLIWE